MNGMVIVQLRNRARLAVAASLALIAVGFPPSSAGACADGHLGVRWGSFQGPVTDFGPVFFYHRVEETANLTITVMGVGDDCSQPPQPVVGTYQVTTPSGVSRPATAGLDYTPVTPRNTGPLYGYHAQGPTEHPDVVPVIEDVLVENVVEEAQALITSSTGYRAIPFDVPLYVIDDEPPERASFASTGPFERAEIYGTIDVPVFRAGPASGTVTYDLSYAGSSGSPAVEGEDFSGPPSITFGSNERTRFISVSIANEGRAEPTEELTVTLTAPGPVLPSDPTSTTLRILDGAGGLSGPSSSLHHPNHRKRYRASAYKIREIHIFTQAGQGPPVDDADFALRQNRKGKRGKRCAWWNGRRFKRGGCNDHRWLPTRLFDPDFFIYRLDELRPTRGRIKSYTAYSRARSGVAQIEGFMEKGRNFNTFKVKKAKNRR